MLLEQLDVAAYLAGHATPGPRRRAQRLTERARDGIGVLTASERVLVLEAASRVEAVAGVARRGARRAVRTQVAVLGAALLGGLLLVTLLQASWEEARRRLELPVVVLPPGAPDRVATYVVLALPGAPAPDGAPGAEPAAEVPPEPVDSPQDGPAEAAAPPPPELEAVVLPDGPAPAAASDAPLDTATADPGEEEDTGLAEDTGAPGAGREGEAAAAELLDRLRLSLPGEGTAGAYVALATEAPMAFSAIGPVADGRRGRTQGLLVARTEVTQAQWTAVMGMDLGSTSGHWENPAEALSWCDALRFANTLSEREGLRAVYRLDDDCERGTEVRWDTRASGFRLLTEAEWLALAEASGPPPTPPPPTERGEQNNRGLGLVDAGRADERYGLAGVADNAREWVWGADAGPAEDPGPARWQAHDDDERRAIVRGCGTFSEVQPTGSDPWCRAELDGAVAPLGVGLRLARGQLPPEA